MKNRSKYLLGAVLAMFALTTTIGCNKNEAADKTPGVKASNAKDVAGMVKETLLIMKFHHDS